MKINPVNEYRIEIELADSEMEQLGISYDDLDWNDIETRRAVWNVLSAARETGIELDVSGRLLIEAGRLKGGCRLCFTSLPRRDDPPAAKDFIRLRKAPVLISGDRQNIERASGILKNAETVLYRRNDIYALLVMDGLTENELLWAGEFCRVNRNAGALAEPFLDVYFQKISV